MQTYRRPSPADAGDHGGAWLLPFPVWLQLGVRAALRSFLVDLFVPKIKLRERERERDNLTMTSITTPIGNSCRQFQILPRFPSSLQCRLQNNLFELVKQLFETII